MKKTLSIILCLTVFLSCHEGIEDRADRNAREYTEKFCPTPVINYTRTDSVTFDKATKTYNYYCSETDMRDSEEIIKANSKAIRDGLLQSIKQNTEIRVYKKAGFTFAYTIYSSEKPGTVYLKLKYMPADYNQK